MWKREKDDLELYREQHSREDSRKTYSTLSEDSRKTYSTLSEDILISEKISTYISRLVFLIVIVSIIVVGVLFIPDTYLGKYVAVKTTIKTALSGTTVEEETVISKEETAELFTKLEIATFNNSYFKTKYLEEVIRQLYNKENIVLLIEQMDSGGEYSYYNYGRKLKDDFLEYDYLGNRVTDKDKVFSQSYDYVKLNQLTLEESGDETECVDDNSSNWLRQTYINGVELEDLYRSEILTDGTFENKIVGVVFTLID